MTIAVFLGTKADRRPQLHLPHSGRSGSGVQRPASSAGLIQPLRPMATAKPAVVRPVRMSNTIAATTGPFEALAPARRVLVLADAENLGYSARDLGVWLDFAALAKVLRARLRRTDLHAVASVEAGQVAAAHAEAGSAGWAGHPRVIYASGRQRCANSDVSCAFLAGVLLMKTQADALIIATGDGALGLDIARGVRSAVPSCQRIATLSIAGSTSKLLDTRSSPEICCNIEIGQDVLLPLGSAGHAIRS